MMKRPILNTGVQVLGKVIGVAISLITTGVLTRKLGVEYYGNFVLISSLFVFLDSLADFGTKTIGVREMAREEDKKVLGNVFNLRMITTLGAFVAGLAVILSFKGVAEFRTEAVVALMMIFLTSLAGFWEIIFQAKQRMDLKVVMDTVFPLAFLGWLWWWDRPLNLLLVFGVYLIARAISLLTGYVLVNQISNFVPKKIEINEVKKLWGMTWPMGVFLIMFATYDRAVDSLLIQAYLGSKEVAWYGLSYKIYGVLLQPAYFYVNSIFPILSGKEKNKKRLLVISTGLLLMAAGGLVVGVQLAAPWMIGVLAGAEYQPAIGVLRILIVAAVFSYLGHLIGFTLIAKGGQGEMLKLGAMALVVNLVMNVILIPRYGILAAAGVTVLTEFLDLMLMAYFLRARLKG